MGNFRKIITIRTKEFFSLWKNYSPIYALYNIFWWVCFYTKPPFCYRLSTYAIKKKTAWLDKYIERKYKYIIGKYKGSFPQKADTIIKEPTIWVFWGQGEDCMPPLVKSCYRQLIRHNKNVVLITNTNIANYIEIPKIVYDKAHNGAISWAYFSDITRNSLLSKYGGLWLDATVWVPNELPIKELMNYRFFSPKDKTTTNCTIRFWSNFDYNWNGWCLWSNSINYPLFSFVADMLIEIAIKERVIPDYATIDYLIFYAAHNLHGIQDDINKTPIISCENRHHLARIMNNEYNEEEYKKLIFKEYFFKLSFRANWKEKTDTGYETFYGRLIKKTF